VKDAIAFKKELSVVRMADGEKMLLDQCNQAQYVGTVDPPMGYEFKWLENMGLSGIRRDELVTRLLGAANGCTYFAPSISGIEDENYNVYDRFPLRAHYVDFFFPDVWSNEQKAELFKIAGHVLLIHGNAHLADSMQLRVQANLGVKVSWLRLLNWTQTQEVISRAAEIDAPLVIFSGGPGGKYIGPKIAKDGNRVVLDIGHAADRWTFEHLPANRKAAEDFHAQWAAKR
jgi:hypothetical protein